MEMETCAFKDSNKYLLRRLKIKRIESRKNYRTKDRSD